MKRKHMRNQRSLGMILTALGIIVLCLIDYRPGLIGFLSANPPFLVLGLSLTGSGIGIFLETLW